MQANAVPFTGSGIIDSDALSVAGMTYTGFTSVIVYNGTDTTGNIVLVGGAAGTYGLSYELLCDKGVYIAAAGAGRGSVWIAG